jgi:hypothetical protein
MADIFQSPTDPIGEDLSDRLPRDGRIAEVTSNLMPVISKAVTEIRGAKPDFVKPIEYKIQEDPCSDEKDTNYFVKVTGF